MTAITDWDQVSLTNSFADAGKVIGVSRSTAYRLVEEGALEAIKVTPRRTIITKAALRSYLRDVEPQNEAKAPVVEPTPPQHLDDNGPFPAEGGGADVSA